MELEVKQDFINSLLKVRGADVPSLSENEFKILVDYLTHNLITEIGISLDPEDHKEINLYNDFEADYYVCEYCNIKSINQIKITTESEEIIVKDNDYSVDLDGGIIRFHRAYDDGTIEVDYTTAIPESYKNTFELLLTDMLLYNLTPEYRNGVTSVHEGDVSISYDTNNTLGASIKQRINSLKSSFGNKATMM